MRSLSMHHDKVRASGLDLSFAAIGVALMKMILTWQERSRERRVLAGLDDYLLRDMGLSRSDVEREVSKTFWQR